EIILLPSNAYSDDDNASTSDDCIYAYRGGEPAGAAGQLLDLQGDLPPDDETDFLEMDFDPEPSSEMETFNRQQDGFLLGLDGEQYGAAAARPPEGQHGPEVDVGEVRAPFAGPLPAVAQPEDTQSNAQQESREQNATVSKSPEPAVNRTEAHKTGAIPKNLPIPVDRPPTLSSNSKNLRLDLTVHSDEPDFVETHRYQDCSLYYYQPAEFSASTSKRSKGLQQQQENEAEEMHCLDCAEQEFLMRTKQDHPARQRYCNTTDHRSVRSYAGPNRTAEAFYPRATEPRMDDEHGTVDDDELLDLRAEQIVFETLHKINTLKETPPTTAGPKAECVQSMAKGSLMPVLEKDDGAAKAHVTLYTVNCNEATITEAFMHLGLLPKESVLRQYATERLEADNAKMTIPQYLLHMSKRDCNYRKLIDVIKSCCDMEPLDVQYYPVSSVVGPIAIDASNLDIIHFKHKHFHTLNVLGKIVNILRQPSRGRDTNYMISIPQYYKSGIIKIMRIAPPSW
ncbi:AGAP008736-PA, partial [Anopheles gambiae str. PEST]